ncbi:MAG: tetratricopeptide repeat protein [Gammaproteobacteria bacterium]|nr:tetratricopeptide repeat protein [Gammaproteobacteria bacterium]
MRQRIGVEPTRRRGRHRLSSSLIGSALAGLGLAHGAPPQPSPETALAAYQEGRYEQAARTLPACAAKGVAECQLALGLLYKAGIGVTHDEYQAFNWVRQAALQGLAPAQVELGLMYVRGIGVTDNLDHALTWVHRAAEQGDPDARRLYPRLLHAEPDGC